MSVLRQLGRSALRSQARAFSVTAAPSKDFVQEIYLRELKNFKPKPAAKDAHVGQVKEFHSPASPSAPQSLSASDLAKELEAYDAQTIVDASAKTATTEVAEEDTSDAGSADAFLEELKRGPIYTDAGHH